MSCFSFFFNDTATPEIYTLSLHDALPISLQRLRAAAARAGIPWVGRRAGQTLTVGAATFSVLNPPEPDRKSTRLNSSHVSISYAVFCLKKKKKKHHACDKAKHKPRDLTRH